MIVWIHGETNKREEMCKGKPLCSSFSSGSRATQKMPRDQNTLVGEVAMTSILNQGLVKWEGFVLILSLNSFLLQI